MESEQFEALSFCDTRYRMLFLVADPEILSLDILLLELHLVIALFLKSGHVVRLRRRQSVLQLRNVIDHGQMILFYIDMAILAGWHFYLLEHWPHSLKN
jgi:hypothetical protein